MLESNKNNLYTAVIQQDGDWWIGWMEEVPGVNCQEASRDELLETLRITLQEALELNRREAIAAAGGNYQEQQIALGIGMNSSDTFALTVAKCSGKVGAIHGGTIQR